MIDLGKKIFNIDLPTQSPQQGLMLVSEPFLDDDYFRHSVIFLVEHEQHGKSMGLVMNHPTGYTLGDVVEGFDDDCDVELYRGGPMSPDHLFYMHRLGPQIIDSIPIAPGLWLGGDYDQIKRYIADPDNPIEGVIRFFIGYSGWDSLQLETELMEHVWAVSNQLPPKKTLSGDGDHYWHKYVRALGPSHRAWRLHPADNTAN